jgi:hypothetical protein
MSEIELRALARKGIEEALRQREQEGSPLAPLLLDESLYGCSLDARHDEDPIRLALAAIPTHLPSVERCALLLDTNFDFGDGKPSHAIVAMACERDGGKGIVLAQRYLARRWFRKFRSEGAIEEMGPCDNFVRAALEGGETDGLSRFLGRVETDLERVAREIMAGYSALFLPERSIREVDLAGFSELDLAFYDTVHQRLSAHGFIHLADVEDETLNSACTSGFPTVVRVMRSEDGRIVASACDLKPRTAIAASTLERRRILALETEFDDGVVLCTSTAEAASPLPAPPSMRFLFLPAGSAPRELLAAHRQQVTQHALDTDTAVRPILDLEAFLAYQQRVIATKAALRQEIGITLEELLASWKIDPAYVRKVHRKIVEIASVEGYSASR